jgi:hypothetical protein
LYQRDNERHVARPLAGLLAHCSMERLMLWRPIVKIRRT